MRHETQPCGHLWQLWFDVLAPPIDTPPPRHIDSNASDRSN